jgi:hypothetical protein
VWIIRSKYQVTTKLLRRIDMAILSTINKINFKAFFIIVISDKGFICLIGHLKNRGAMAP